MNEMQVFRNEQFGWDLRSISIQGNPCFWTKDVVDILKLANPRSSMALLDEDEKGVHIMDTPGGKQNVNYVTEAGLYTLVLKSRRPEAKLFRRWITHEVIPSIRQTGGYIMGEEKMTDDELLSSALIMANNKLEQRGLRIKALEAQIELDRPKTIFYDAISASTSSISFGAMAKLAHNNGYDIGRNRFVALLIEHGFVMRDGKNLVPTQRAINLGVLEPKESYYGDNKTGIRITCVVTGKGQVYFMDFIYKLFNGQLGA